MIVKTIKTSTKTLGILLLILVFFGLFPIELFVDVVVSLGFGWVLFPLRVLPQVTLNPAAIGMALVCSVLFIVGTQRICCWLYQHFRAQLPEQSVWPSQWPWRWAIGLYAVVWVLFLTAMASTGIMHQVGWLARSKEPIVVNNSRYSNRARWIQMHAMSRSILAGCEAEGWNRTNVLTTCELASRHSGRLEFHEKNHLTIFDKPDGEVQAVLLAYREPHLREEIGFWLIESAGVTNLPIAQLHQTVEKLVNYQLSSSTTPSK